MNWLLEEAEIISLFVRKISEKNPEHQIGKTIIQKMMYLFEIEYNNKYEDQKQYDFDYTLYHYGPYSFEINQALNMAKNMKFVSITWNPEKGYFIKPRTINIENQINENMDQIEEIVEDLVNGYGSYYARELSIIATAIYVKQHNTDIHDDDLVEIVAALKPKYNVQSIRRILIDANIINH